MDSSSQERGFISALIETVLAGGGLLLFFLWWNRHKDKTPEEPKTLQDVDDATELPNGEVDSEGLKNDDTETRISEDTKRSCEKNATVKTEASTQTQDTTIWKAVWVCGGSSDPSSNRYRSELHLDLSTGATTRSEKIQYTPRTSTIAVVA